MTSFLTDKKENHCCGCRSCEQICPTDCIVMEMKEGFWYPTVDKTKCINCGLCTKACQYGKLEELFHEEEQTVYSAWHKEAIEVLKSTSGAAFAAVSDYILSEGGVVYGAALDIKNRRVIIQAASTKEDRDILRKSKYVWSDTGNSYSEIKKHLISGQKVLFSGTPCQVAGLRSYLGKNYENLYCIDILCHGLPSAILFQSYVEYLEKKHDSEVVDFEFRKKRKGFMQTEYSIKFANGFEIHEGLDKNAYSLTYNSLIAHMPACNTCPYAGTQRVSDLTIGDFWGIEALENAQKNETGTSVIIANTSKGQRLLSQITDLMKFENDLDYAKKYNPPLRYAVKRHPWNKKFIISLEQRGFEKTYKQYIQVGNKVMLIYRVFRKVKEMISKRIGRAKENS